MKLEFKIYQIKKDTQTYTDLITKSKLPNQFIIVGEYNYNQESDCYKANPIYEDGFGCTGVFFDRCSLLIDKNDLELRRSNPLCLYESQVFDIPEDLLYNELIDTIKKLNKN
jgi:hypothetical protein